MQCQGSSLELPPPGGVKGRVSGGRFGGKAQGKAERAGVRVCVAGGDAPHQPAPVLGGKLEALPFPAGRNSEIS